MMSISPAVGHGVPVRYVEPSIQNAGQYPVPFAVVRFESGCWIAACIRTTPPGAAPKSSRFVSMRPEYQVVCVLVALMTSVPAPSLKTLAVLFVMVSISPVPKLRPGPVSYFHTVVSAPVPAAPVKSSLQKSVNPDGGAGIP